MRGPDRVLAVLRQLTSSDRVLLELLYDHQVLTTDQISVALLPNLDIAQHRLVKLVGLELVERFRPLPGRASPAAPSVPPGLANRLDALDTEIRRGRRRRTPENGEAHDDRTAG